MPVDDQVEQEIEVLDECPVSRPVTLRGKDGTPETCKVCELSPEDFAGWLQSSQTDTKKKGKTLTREGIMKSQEEKDNLIWWCLIDSHGARLERDRIASWGTGTRGRLAEICVEVNRLGGKV